MKNKILLIALLGIFLSLSYASAFLGTFNQGECVPIVVPLNSSFVNISQITSPSPSPEIIQTNIPMIKNSTGSFIYYFCNTSKIGDYTYSFIGDTGKTYGNDFTIKTKSFFNLDFNKGTGVTIFIILLVISAVLFLFVNQELGSIAFVVTGVISMVNNDNLFIGFLVFILGIALAFVPKNK